MQSWSQIRKSCTSAYTGIPGGWTRGSLLAMISPEMIKLIYNQQNLCENPYEFGSQSKNPNVPRYVAMENKNHCLQSHIFHESITGFPVCFEFSRVKLV